MWGFIIRSLTGSLSKLFFPLKILGTENIPKAGGFILASNHLSNIDPFVVGLAAQPRWLTYMAKDSLFQNKIFGYILSKCGAFPLKRENRDIGAMKGALKRLKSGYGLLVFPEGTRRRQNHQNEFLPGVGFLAIKSGVPIIPVLVKDTDKVLPPGGRWLSRSKVEVHFGLPIIPALSESYESITNRVMDSVDLLAAKV